MAFEFDKTVANYLKLIGQPAAGQPVAMPTVEGARKGSQDISNGVSPCKMESINNIVINGPHGEITLRIFKPYGLPDNQLASGMVFYHGGGWVIGTLDAYTPICTYLAEKSRCYIISVDYKLAPEYKFPVAHEECIFAWEWVVQHAESLGIDPERLSVCGDSAGANLATVAAIHARNNKLTMPKAQLLFYPVTDLADEYPSYARVTSGVPLTADKMRWYSSLYLNSRQDALDWRASPLRANDLSGLPQTFIVTLGQDPLSDEGIAYAQRLQVAGVVVSHLHLSGMIHGFLRMAKVIWASKPVMEFAAAMQRTI